MRAGAMGRYGAARTAPHRCARGALLL